MSPATTWEAVPDECWETVFGRTDQYEPLSLVNKRFLAITNLARATLTVSSPISSPLSFLYARFPNLTSLHLSEAHPGLDGFVRHLARSNLPLRSLRLSKQAGFPREAMRLLGRSGVSRTLKDLLLTCFHRLDDDDLFVVADCFSYLQRLELENWAAFRDREQSITDHGIHAISITLKSLISLTIFCNQDITHRSFQYLSSNCPLLSDIKVKNNGNSRDETLARIEYFGSFVALASLNLSHANISESGLLQLSRANLKIWKLFLGCPQRRNFKGSAMCRFLSSCRSLRHLKMKFMEFSNDVEPMDFVTSIPNVQVLNICNVCLPHTILFDLLQGCPNLEDFILKLAYVEIVKYSSDNFPIHRRLRKLVLKNWGVRDETLKLIGSICPNLESFSVSSSSEITEHGVKAIMAGCRDIKQLDVIRCENVKDFSWGNKRPRILV